MPQRRTSKPAYLVVVDVAVSVSMLLRCLLSASSVKPVDLVPASAVVRQPNPQGKAFVVEKRARGIGLLARLVRIEQDV